MATVADTKPAPKLTEVGKVAEVKKTAQEAAEAGAAQARKLVDDGAAVALEVVGKGAEGAQKVMERNMEQANKAAEGLFKAAEEAAEFGRGNVEAFAKATQVYVAGVQDLGRQTFALVQGLTDHALEGAKALSAVKSLQEAAQIQANYTRTAFERSVNEGTRLQEAALKLAEQSLAPLTARVNLAIEKLGRRPLPAAA